ncbi:MAG: major facilitator superfamily 1 [Bryobacterales bacterium]|nr:major facilitator superfamily 1 [Bryobacterales bacterium]
MRKWSLVTLLGLGVIIAYIDRTNLAIALASAEFKQFFALSDTGRGVLNSVFFWSYTVMQIPAGLLVDRFGVKRPLAISFVLWCMVAAATAVAGAFWELVALRLMLGVAESTLFPAGLAWLAKHIDERQRGFATGIFVSGSKWGPAIASPLATWLILGYGWRTMFFLLGLGGLVWVIPWMLLAQDDKPGNPRLKAVTQGDPPPSFGALFRTRAMWATLIGTFCYNYFLFFSLTWMPAYLVESRNLSLSSMSIYTMFSFAGTGIVAILAGAAADWFIRRGASAVNTRRWFTIAGLLAASTEVFGAMSESTGVAVFFAIFSMTGLGLATANYWAITQTLLPGVAPGRVAGIQNTALNLAGIVAPIITGWLKQVTGGYTAPMQTIWVFLIIGIGAYLFLARESKPQLHVVSA